MAYENILVETRDGVGVITLNRPHALNALCAAMIDRQSTGHPVSEWAPARLDEAGGWKHNFVKVSNPRHVS